MDAFTKIEFPDRKNIVKNYMYNLVEDIKNLDTESIDFNSDNEDIKTEIVQDSKIYFWVRIYLKEELSIKPNTDVEIMYLPSGEKLVTKFICYSKKGDFKMDGDDNPFIKEWNPDDDRKVLCVMVDQDHINKYSDHIPFIRTLFKISRWYTPPVLRKSEISISTNSKSLDWYDIDF